jgi:hypothetical protein
MPLSWSAKVTAALSGFAASLYAGSLYLGGAAVEWHEQAQLVGSLVWM